MYLMPLNCTLQDGLNDRCYIYFATIFKRLNFNLKMFPVHRKTDVLP